jgi:hypothetical protein
MKGTALVHGGGLKMPSIEAMLGESVRVIDGVFQDGVQSFLNSLGDGVVVAGVRDASVFVQLDEVRHDQYGWGRGTDDLKIIVHIGWSRESLDNHIDWLARLCSWVDAHLQKERVPLEVISKYRVVFVIGGHGVGAVYARQPDDEESLYYHHWCDDPLKPVPPADMPKVPPPI